MTLFEETLPPLEQRVLYQARKSGPVRWLIPYLVGLNLAGTQRRFGPAITFR